MAKPKALLIAEKPSLMREIQSAYKSLSTCPYEIDFMAQAGHLVELLSPSEIDAKYKSWDVNLLPINPEHHGGWKYKVSADKKKLFNDIKDTIKKGNYNYIIHAGDAGQEGELLIRLVLMQIGNKLPVLRFWNNDLTTRGIHYSLMNMKSDNEPEYENLFHAALLRQHADWLIGMNGSRACASTIKIPYGTKDLKIALGRVMTWVQSKVVEREDAINNFKPSTSYNLVENVGFDASNVEENPEKKNEYTQSFYEKKSDVQALQNRMSGQSKVINVKKSVEKKQPPKLFCLDEAQIECAKKFGFKASKTLDIIQSLYEKKLVTYPRTECEVISSEENLSEIIDICLGLGFDDACNKAHTMEKTILSNTRYVNDDELKKHDHGALIPTTEKARLNSLSLDEQNVYLLIVKRFLTIFQDPMTQDTMTVLLENNGEVFRWQGKTLVSPGYTEFTGETVNSVILPNVNNGDILNVKEFKIVEKTTTCPKRFTDATLIQAMKNPSKYLEDKDLRNGLDGLSIGTPATRGSIIDKLFDNKYLINKKGIIYPTDFSMFMIHAIKDLSLNKIDTTALWEQNLKKIREGTMSYEDGEKFINAQTEQVVNDLKAMPTQTYGSTGSNTNGSSKEVIATCPKCGKNIYESAKSFYCEGFKDENPCQTSIFKEYIGSKISKNDAKKLFEGKEIEKELTSNAGKKWTQKVKFNTDTGRMEFVQSTGFEPVETNFECPNCKKHLFKNGVKLECSCGVAIWTKICQKQLPDNQIQSILTTGMSNGWIDGFVRQDGREFAGKVKLDCTDGKYSFKLDFSR